VICLGSATDEFLIIPPDNCCSKYHKLLLWLKFDLRDVSVALSMFLLELMAV
jgi:hypothetical protein